MTPQHRLGYCPKGFLTVSSFQELELPNNPFAASFSMKVCHLAFHSSCARSAALGSCYRRYFLLPKHAVYSHISVFVHVVFLPSLSLLCQAKALLMFQGSSDNVNCTVTHSQTSFLFSHGVPRALCL